MVMQVTSGSMSPEKQRYETTTHVHLIGCLFHHHSGGDPGSIFTALLNGTAAISSSFASAVCSTGCWARACTGKPSSGGAVGWASTMARPGSSGNRAAKARLGGDGL